MSNLKVSKATSVITPESIERITESLVPKQAFFTLKEVCALKGLNYKTACNKKYLQPNGGRADGYVGGRKVFSRLTVIGWLFKTDEEILREWGREDVH